MDITNQLLGLLKDAMWSLRFFVGLLIVVSFLKTCLTLWLNYRIKKLEHKSTFQIVCDGNHKAINLTTSEEIQFERLERHLINSQFLISECDKDKKNAA